MVNTTIATTTARTQLKKTVRQYLDVMRSLGCGPNRTVAFESVARAAWLIDDPVPHAKRRRYLLLDDGDTWCETVFGPQPASSGLVNTYRWLAEPTPALTYTLGCSFDNARDGGSGFLIPAIEAGVLYSVSDRRAVPRT